MNTITEITFEDLSSIISTQLSSNAKRGESVLLGDLTLINTISGIPVDTSSLAIRLDIIRVKADRKKMILMGDIVSLDQIMLTEISLFDISTHIKNFLTRSGLTHVWQLAVLSGTALCEIDGIGKVSVRNIRSRLRSMPRYNRALEIAFRNVFFRKFFDFRVSELSSVQELSLVRSTNRISEIETFIISHFK